MDDQSDNRLVEILLVEDNPTDAFMIREAFQAGTARPNLHEVSDGREALAFLRRQGGHQGAPKPDLILLDLSLPGVNGHDVLAEIKSDPRLRRIPVIMMSTTRARQSMLKSYDLHVNCYLIKPVAADKFFEMVEAIEAFWLHFVQLPGPP